MVDPWPAGRFGGLPRIFSALLVAVLVVGCGAPTPELETVRLRLNWLHEAEFAGYYMAVRQDLYQVRGLNVEILEGGPSSRVMEEVRRGEVDYGVIGVMDLPADPEESGEIAILAAIYQISPSVLLVRSGRGIRRLQDVPGHRVGIKNENWRRAIHRAFHLTGLDPKDIIEVPVEPSIQPFLDDQVDVWTGYAQSEPITARLHGVEVDLIHLSEYGLDTYNGLIITTRDRANRRPDQVTAFLRASLEGWQRAIRSPQQAADAILSYKPELDRNFQEKAMEAIAPLVHTGEAALGWIDLERWHRSTAHFVTPVPEPDLRFLHLLYRAQDPRRE